MFKTNFSENNKIWEAEQKNLGVTAPECPMVTDLVSGLAQVLIRQPTSQIMEKNRT